MAGRLNGYEIVKVVELFKDISIMAGPRGFFLGVSPFRGISWKTWRSLKRKVDALQPREKGRRRCVRSSTV